MGLKKRKLAIFRPKLQQQSAITSKRYEIRCQLVLITNRKLHLYGLSIGIPTSMILNDVIVFILRYISPNSIALEADYVKVVEDRPIMSAECRLLLLAKTDPPCSAVCLR